MKSENLTEKMSKEEFAKAVKKCYKDLYCVAYTYMQNEENAKDAVGDAVLKAYEKKGMLRDCEKFNAWMMKIVVNTCKTSLLRQKKVILVEDVNGLETRTILKGDEMCEMILKLDTELRQVVGLYYYQELSVREISRRLGVAEGTVKSRLSRARGQLKKLLVTVQQ